jgi:D-alanyl-D-alanine dipeptidase
MIAKILFGALIIGLILSSCESDSIPENPQNEVEEEITVPDEQGIQKIKDSIAVVKRDSMTISYMKSFNLIDVLTVEPTIQIDLRYATANNFMGHVLYDTLNALYLQEDVAQRIAGCQSYLKAKFPNYSLLIYDGVRPLEVQREMWNGLDTIPAAQRGNFVSNPSYGSVHNFGAAVDLTICDETGTPIDMGAGYDDFRDIAFPSKEWKFLASGELTTEQHENRKLLREVMKSQRFRGIPSEWWHFNACSRNQAVAKYKKLMFESGVTENGSTK